MNSWMLCWQEVVPAASRKRLCEKTDYVDLEAPAAKKHAELNLRCVANSQQETMAVVLGIRIPRICMFLDLSDPDLLVRGTDPDPDPSLF
jgi:hypothetical protein